MIRAFLCVVLAYSFSIAKAEKLIGIETFPTFEEITTHFYKSYAPEAGENSALVFAFARKPDGWYLNVTDLSISQTDENYFTLWHVDSGYLQLNQFSKNNGKAAAKWPDYQSAKHTADAFQQRMFKLHTYFGYKGWADDVVSLLQNKNDLGSNNLYSLGRAYSAIAGALMNHNAGASRLQIFSFNTAGNSLNNEQLLTYIELNKNACKAFKQIVDTDSLFFDIVGNIKTKYANEVVQAYLDLWIFQNAGIAKKQLTENIYPADMLANAANTLDNCPQNSIFISYGDNDFYPLIYLQQTQNYRPDVKVINYSLLGLSQYISALGRYNEVHFNLSATLYNSIEYLRKSEKASEQSAETFIKNLNDEQPENGAEVDFPVFSCKQQTTSIKNDYLYKHHLALIDLAFSNKNLPFCTAHTHDPVDIFGEHFLNIGLIYRLDLCQPSGADFKTALKYFQHIKTDAYCQAYLFPKKPGTDDYINVKTIQTLYNQLLLHMQTTCKEGKTEACKQFDLIWKQWSENWAVKPTEKEKEIYQQILADVKGLKR